MFTRYMPLQIFVRLLLILFISGVLPQDLLGIIRILVSMGWFQLDEYNKALRDFKYSTKEASNKPQQVVGQLRIKKLSGKATSHWLHIRIFPYILYVNKWIKQKQDMVFQLALQLNEITAYITADKIQEHEITILEAVIESYLDNRNSVYEKFPDLLGRPKPKHHYLVHYPEAIRNFGPPSSFWTGRYESKHRISKSISESSKNFINITHTVSFRHQFRMCSVYYNGMFDESFYTLPTKVVKKDDLTDSDLDRELKPFLSSKADLLCSEIVYKCRKYVAGDVVVINRNDLLTLEVGVVKAIHVGKRGVSLIVRRYRAEMIGQLPLFLCSKVRQDFMSNNLVSVSMKDLSDTYPIMKRGTEDQFLIILHHHVSFKYE